MSTPQEKKTPQTRAEREEKRRQEERADRRTMAIYTVVGVVVVLAAIIMMVWTSGILQRNLTAVEIEGTKFSSVDLQYYYNAAYSEELNRGLSANSTYPFDTTTSVKDQVYDEESGLSWYDYLTSLAIKNLMTDVALADQATQAGYTLSEEAQTELDDFRSQLETVWLGYGYSNQADFIRASYGNYMTYDRLMSLVEREVLANDYANTQVDAIEYSDEEYDAYYQEHASELDTYSYSQFTFRAQVETTDDEGNTVEMTEEEQAAALEKLRSEQSALAQELQSRLEAGEDPAALAEAYADQLYSSSLDQKRTGANLVSATYADWLLDSARVAGDTTVSEYETGTSVYFYVVLFQGRELDDTPTADVRHILVAAEQDEGADEPTQEQYDAAYTQAEELLAQWKDGEATEESFTQLAVEHSADSAVSSNEGLYSVSSTSGYDANFMDWALDPSRQPGDTGIVQNTTSSVKGWHIMYYVSSGDPIWRQTVTAAFREDDYDALDAQAIKSYTYTTGIGLNFITE